MAFRNCCGPVCLKVLVALLFLLPVLLSTTGFGRVLFPRKQEGKPEDGSKVVEVADDSQPLPQTAKSSPKKPGELGERGGEMLTTHQGYLAFPTVRLKGKINENYHVAGKYPPITEK